VNAPLVSIVIPTCNGEATLPAVLAAIRTQEVDFPFETIAIDSGSTDGTTECLDGRVDQVVSIDPATFDHGLTRNLGIERSRGDYVVLMAQDAEPANEHWLAALVASLRSDPRLAGVFARQVARPDASPLTRHYLQRWTGASTERRTVSMTMNEFESLAPALRVDRCTFDNVCSCIRRDIWRDHPFRATPIGEDVEWAKAVLLAGFHIAFEPAAAVVHSHDRSARYEFARTRALHRRFHELFGLRTIPSLPLLARAIISSLAAHLRCDPGLRSLALAFAWPVGQYLGGRSAVRSAVRQR
jgi:glycosyltransferase involved in cell wall biosynthesis